MLLWLSFYDFEKELCDIIVVHLQISKHLAHIKLEMTAEAGAKLPFAGETKFIASLAEVKVCHRSDETNQLARLRQFVVAGRTVGAKVRARGEFSKPKFNELLGFSSREKVFLCQHVGRAHRHELDEAQEKVTLAGEFDEIPEFVFVAVAHQHGVDFDLFKTGFAGGIDAFDRAGENVASSRFCVGFPVKGIQGDVDSTNAGVFERLGRGDSLRSHLTKQGPIGRYANIIDSLDAVQLFKEPEHVSAGEGLASRDAELGNAHAGSNPDRAQNLFVAEDFLTGEPLLRFYWHAILAAFVTSIGDRDAQVVDMMAKTVLHRKSAHSFPTNDPIPGKFNGLANVSHKISAGFESPAGVPTIPIAGMDAVASVVGTVDIRVA